MFYFHPFDIPKRVPLESFTIEGSESFRSVVVIIENRDEHLKDKLAVSVVFVLHSLDVPHDLPRSGTLQVEMKGGETAHCISGDTGISSIPDTRWPVCSS